METGTTHWEGNTGATNESGFAALPGDALIDTCGMYFAHEIAVWWSSSQWYSFYDDNFWEKYFYFEYPTINGFTTKFSFGPLGDMSDRLGSGFSVRCVKD